MASNKRSLKDIEEQIAKLQEEAEKIRTSEKAEVIERIKEAVKHYGITAAEIGLAGAVRGGRKAKVASKAKTGTAAPVKYKDDAGNSWSGHGRKPQWFVAALKAGKSEDDLLA